MEELIITTTDVMTLSDAAKYLGVSRPTLYKLISKNKLHPVKFGRNKYLIRSEVERIKNG